MSARPSPTPTPRFHQPKLLCWVDHHREGRALLSAAGAAVVCGAAGVRHEDTGSGLRRLWLRHVPAVVAVAESWGGYVRLLHVDNSECHGADCANRPDG